MSKKREREAVQVGEALQTIHRVLRGRLYAEAARLPSPLTPPQLLAMKALVHHGREDPARSAMSLSALSDAIGLSHSTVSGIVDRLERQGLVVRSPRPEDRRYTDIRLAPDAAAWVAEELPARRAEPLTAVAAEAPDKDWAAIVRGVTLLASLLETEQPPKSDRS